MTGYEEPPSHTFIVNVWVEGLDEEGFANLRAYILNVREDERDKPHYKTDLADIAEHIAAYLRRMRVNPSKLRPFDRPNRGES